MRYLMVLLTLLPTCALAQELSAEDRACITTAAGKLPPVAALEIKGSRGGDPQSGDRTHEKFSD
jgi:hypothetical protein